MKKPPVFLRLAQIIEEALHASLDDTDQAIYERVHQKHFDCKATAIELAIEETVVRQRAHDLVLKVRDEVYERIRGDRDLQRALRDLLDDLEAEELLLQTHQRAGSIR